MQSSYGTCLQEFDGLSVIFSKNFDDSLLYTIDSTWEHSLIVSELNEPKIKMIERFTDIQLEKD